VKTITAILKKPSSLVFTDQLIFSGSNFVLTFVLARKLGIADFGLFSSVLLATYLLVGICNSVLVQPFQISVAKKFTNKSLGFVLQSLLVLLGVFASLMFLVKLLPFSSIGFYKTHFLSIVTFSSAYILQDFLRKILLALDRVKLVLMIDCIFLIVFPVIWFQEDLDLKQSLFVIGIVNGIASLPGAWFCIKNSKFSFKNKELFNYHFKEGKWLFSASVLQWFSGNFFTLVAGVYLGINALGALRLVQSFFGIINVILQTVENYYLPKTAKLYFQNKTEEKKELYLNMLKGMMVLATVITGFFMFSDSIMVLIGGEKYEQYGFVVKLVSVLYFVILYSYPVRISIRVMEQNKAFFVGYCISFVFSVASFHFLLKYGALYGAVAGLLINQIVMIVYWKILLYKKQISLWA